MDEPKKKGKTKGVVSQNEAVEILINIFPGVEKDVVLALLDANGYRLQKTIDSLLMITKDQPETPVNGNSFSNARAENDNPESYSPTAEKQSNPEQQLKDDEMLARSLQAQWSDTSNPDDERLAADLQRMERDERMARKLQSLETQLSQYYPSDNEHSFYVRPSGPGTIVESVRMNTTKNEPTEPISTQIDKKLSELGQDIKSGFSVFATKLVQAFQPVSPPPPDMVQTSQPVQTLVPFQTQTPTSTPTSSPTPTSTSRQTSPTQPIQPTTSSYISRFDIGDQEENDFISDDEEETFPLIERKERKSVVLMINTE